MQSVTQRVVVVGVVDWGVDFAAADMSRTSVITRDHFSLQHHFLSSCLASGVSPPSFAYSLFISFLFFVFLHVAKDARR